MVKYSIWVGGGEVNSEYIYSLKEAKEIAECWKEKGDDDVIIERVA